MLWGGVGVWGWWLVGLSSGGGGYRGWFGLLWVVVGFAYWCGAFHAGFVALWLVLWCLGVVVL